MIKTFFYLLPFLFIGCKNTDESKIVALNENKIVMQKQNIYQFKVTDLYGNPFDFSTLKGKKIMIVNTASECGLTPQYRDLEAIYEKYKDQNFVIVGFPANNFGAQEPGSDSEIATFCKKNYVLLSL